MKKESESIEKHPEYLRGYHEGFIEGHNKSIEHFLEYINKSQKPQQVVIKSRKGNDTKQE